MCFGSRSAGSARVRSTFLCWKQYLLMTYLTPLIVYKGIAGELPEKHILALCTKSRI